MDRQFACHVFLDGLSHTSVLREKKSVKTVGEIVEAFNWKSTEADRGSDWDLTISKPFKMKSIGSTSSELTRSCVKRRLVRRGQEFKGEKHNQHNSNENDGSVLYKQLKVADRSGGWLLQVRSLIFTRWP